MADQVPQAPQKTHAENVINKIVDLVPELRSHMGANFKKIHDEVLKLIPTGGISTAITEELETVKAKVVELQAALDGADAKTKEVVDELTAKGDQLAADLKAALDNVEHLKQDAETRINQLQVANSTIETLTAQVEELKPKAQ